MIGVNNYFSYCFPYFPIFQILIHTLFNFYSNFSSKHGSVPESERKCKRSGTWLELNGQHLTGVEPGKACEFRSRWQTQFGCQPAKPKVIVEAQTEDEQRIALSAIQRSCCPRVFGLDSEHITSKRNNFTKGGYEKRLVLALEQTPEVRAQMIADGKWPTMRNKDWPSTVPLLTNPDNFWKSKDGIRTPRTGPLIRTVQLANVEGLVVIIDPLHKGGNYSMSDEVADFLGDPSIVKFIHAPLQDWLALGFSFSNSESFLKRIRNGDGCKEMTPEILAEAGWINVQPEIDKTKLNLDASMKVHGISPDLIDHYARLKTQMSRLFKLQLAVARQFDYFQRIHLPDGQHANLATNFIEYGAIDSLAALYIGVLHALHFDPVPRLPKTYLADQLLDKYLLYSACNETRPWQESECMRFRYQGPCKVNQEAWNCMRKTLAHLWPGMEGSNKFSRILHD